jgi:hypothetical protein
MFDDGHGRYIQVKAAVDATGLVNIGWFKLPTSGPLLKRIYESWKAMDASAEVGLITSRPLDPADPLVGHRDRWNRLGARLRRLKSTAVTSALLDLASSVGCEVDELLSFLDVFEIQLGQTEADWRNKVDDAAVGAGIRSDDAAIAIGLAQMREWVKTTRTPKSVSEIRELVDSLGIRAGVPRKVVVVQALDWLPNTSDDLVLDWVDRFKGDNPRNRRGLVDPADWRETFPRELAELREALRTDRVTHVAVRGAMRLPTWFAVGANLLDVEGFDVAAVDRGTLWANESKSVTYPAVSVILDQSTSPAANEVALIVEMSAAAHKDAVDFFQGQARVGRLVVITVEGGPDRALFGGGPDAMAAAVAVRDWVRAHLGQDELHLVLISNGPFALFLGHLWDRVPPTTVYEDLVTEYEPAFRFVN